MANEAKNYIKVCDRCGKNFETDKARKRTCPFCERKAYLRKPQNEPENRQRFHRVNPDAIDIRQMTAIIERYNKANGTHYTYGQFVDLVNSSKIKL